MWKCTSMRYGLPNLDLLLHLLLKPDNPYPKSCTSVASYCEADCVSYCLQEVLQELNYDEEVNNIRYCYENLPFAACFHR